MTASMRHRTIGAAVAAFVAVAVLLAFPAGPARAQDTTTSSPTTASSSTTTFDPSVDTAPALELTPEDTTATDDTESSDSSDTTGKAVIFAAAILLPLAGIAFLVWYARRLARAANARAEAQSTKKSSGEPGDEPAADDDA